MYVVFFTVRGIWRNLATLLLLFQIDFRWLISFTHTWPTLKFLHFSIQKKNCCIAVRQGHYYACFTSGRTEIQRDRMTCLRSHSKLMAEPELKLRSLTTQSSTIFIKGYIYDNQYHNTYVKQAFKGFEAYEKDGEYLLITKQTYVLKL